MAFMTKTLCGSEINPFCFGTMQWDGGADPAAVESHCQMYRDASINHFDKPYAYCERTTEKFLDALFDKCPDEILIATKVGYVGDAYKTNILAQFDQCQTRFKMDVIDVLYPHRFDPETSLEETPETFARLKQSGKIHYLGFSNFSAWQGLDTVHRTGLFGLNIFFFQPMYILVQRQAEVKSLPMCAANGITVTNYSPLGVGLLTGSFLRGEWGRLIEDSRYALRYEPAFMPNSEKKLRDLADALCADPATLAVASLHAHPTKPIPIISASDVDQLVQLIEVMACPVSEELFHQISNLSPKTTTCNR